MQKRTSAIAKKKKYIYFLLLLLFSMNIQTVPIQLREVVATLTDWWWRPGFIETSQIPSNFKVCVFQAMFCLLNIRVHTNEKTNHLLSYQIDPNVTIKMTVWERLLKQTLQASSHKEKIINEMLNSHFHCSPRHEDKCDIPLHLLWACLFAAGY